MAIPKKACSVKTYVGQGGFALPLFFNEPMERRTMFKFEVLVGSKGHEAIMSKLLDLAAEGKEVHYEEAPGAIEVKSNGQTYKLEGMIAKGHAFT